jgi:hypothetical protein
VQHWNGGQVEQQDVLQPAEEPLPASAAIRIILVLALCSWALVAWLASLLIF